MFNVHQGGTLEVKLPAKSVVVRALKCAFPGVAS